MSLLQASLASTGLYTLLSLILKKPGHVYLSVSDEPEHESKLLGVYNKYL